MKHFGDITKISGYEVPTVDIVTGGSPCQDLSVAGKRAGLAGERSGLFMEQIRIIKEMREKEIQSGKANDDIRPRYMVWENVPGAFSSNKGEDFRAVLEETAKVVDKDAVIPEPEKGKWTPSGCIVGDGWSIAWRVHDAQFWGVPQRRKRISLVADFGGQSAPEILFERNGVSGDIETSGQKRQGTSEDAERCVGKTGYGVVTKGNGDAFINPDTHTSLSLGGGQAGQGYPCVLETQKTDNKLFDVRISSDGNKNWRAHCYETEISRALDTGGENPDSNHGGVAIIEAQGFPLGFRPENTRCYEEKSTTICNGTRPGFTCGVIGFNRGNGSGIPAMEEKQPTLQAAAGESGNNQPLVCQTIPENQSVYCLQGNGIDRADTAGCNGKGWRENESYTLNTIDRPAVCYRKQEEDVVCIGNGQINQLKESEKVGALNCIHDQQALLIRNTNSDKNISSIFTIGHDVRSCKFTDDEKTDPLTATDYKDPIKVTYQEVTGTLSVGSHGGSYNGQDAYNDMLITQPAFGIDCFNQTQTEEVSRTLLAGRNDKKSIPCTYGIDCYNQTQSEEQTMGITSAVTDPNHIPCTYQNVTGTIDCCISKGTSNQLANNDMFVANSIVRRLTPLECERLQGYPDYWTDIGEWIDSKGKKHKDADSPRYKALGNSIALPFWQWMAYRMCSYLKEPTMASLFDGIGGFPLVFSRAGCKPIWASEIEEFPIAVTKIRFPEE